MEIECTGLRSILVSISSDNERGSGRVHHSSWDSTGSNNQRRILDGIPTSDIAEFPRRQSSNSSAQRRSPERHRATQPTTEPVRMQPVRDGLFVYRIKTTTQGLGHTLAGIEENPGSAAALSSADDSAPTAAATRLEGNMVRVAYITTFVCMIDCLLTPPLNLRLSL